MNEICKNCKWWERKHSHEGECRRHSPVVIQVETPASKKTTHYQTNIHLVTRWPSTLFSQGCGDFEKEE